MNEAEASVAAEKVAKMLFTGSDGETFTDLLQIAENGITQGMHMDWAYVVNNVRRILIDG